MIVLHTNFGDITFELDFENSPKSCRNFRRYADLGYYNGTIFHRVIPNFMIQGGGFEPGMKQKKVGNPIENEADNGVPNLKGTIAMARTTDPHSATAQFFINVTDNEFLNHTAKNPQGWGYAVFGTITEGMEVIDSIKDNATGSSGNHKDVPLEDIIIEKVTVNIPDDAEEE